MKAHRGITLAGLALAVLTPHVTLGQAPPTTNPHGELRGIADCGACHTAAGWRPIARAPSFDHDRQTRFPLAGRHAEADCVGCHLDIRFDAPDLDTEQCAACHVDVHRGKLAERCTVCHNTESFQDVAGVSVHARTSFPLSGAHLQVSCAACHPDDRDGAFTVVNTDCLACHRRDYETAQPIDHVDAGFSTRCDECHSSLAWSHSVAFEHVVVSNGFDLIGAHADIRCSSCHAPPDLRPLFTATDENECIACHQTEFDQEHAGTGFPVTCLTCHTALSWSGAVFADHDDQFFPISRGPHSNRECTTCHTSPGNFAVFSCLTCHEHSQPRMDDKHREENGYVYESTACLSCHPNGRKEED